MTYLRGIGATLRELQDELELQDQPPVPVPPAPVSEALDADDRRVEDEPAHRRAYLGD